MRGSQEDIACHKCIVLNMRPCSRLCASPIPVISDSPSIVALTGEVSDGVVRDLVVLVYEHLELADADAEVRLVEPIGDVPAEGAKLPPLLDQGMEEA